MLVRIAAACLCSVLMAQSAPQAQFEQAAAALQRGDLEAAERLFAEFVKVQPRHVGGLGNLGVVYSRQGLPAKAAEVWERALRLAPSDPALRTNLGLAYLRLEEFPKAREVLTPVSTAQGRELFATAQLFAGDPRAAMATLAPLASSSGVLYLRAVAQLKLGLRDDAAATFAQLVESSLNADQVAFLKGKALYESGAFEEAIATFAAVKTALPGLALERGKAYVSLRDSARAEEELRAAIGETPLDAEANYFLGAILVQQDRAAEGIAMLEKSLRARPAFWGTHFYLGRGYLALKKPKDAIAALERARVLRPEEAQVDFQLSRAYTAAGQAASARVALERYRKAREAHREAEREALVLR